MNHDVITEDFRQFEDVMGRLHDTRNYQTTTSSSMEESIAKAIDIFNADRQEAKKIRANTLVYPQKPLWRGFCLIMFILIVYFFLIFGRSEVLKYLPMNSGVYLVVVLLSCVLLVLACLKPFVIWSIRVYQRFAPKSVRMRCVFVPSCSEYMILSIQKEGLIHGIKKGVIRLNRCHWPNGGIDMP